jgi:hypothetical protein
MVLAATAFIPSGYAAREVDGTGSASPSAPPPTCAGIPTGGASIRFSAVAGSRTLSGRADVIFLISTGPTAFTTDSASIRINSGSLTSNAFSLTGLGDLNCALPPGTIAASVTASIAGTCALAVTISYSDMQAPPQLSLATLLAVLRPTSLPHFFYSSTTTASHCRQIIPRILCRPTINFDLTLHSRSKNKTLATHA